jgi:phosphatidate cytidylyltransferase
LTLQRILTAAVLIPIVVGIVWWGSPAIVAALAAVVLLLALWELFRLGDRLGLRAYRRWTIFCAILLMYVQWLAGRVETRPLGFGVELLRNAGSGAASVEGLLLLFVLGACGIGVISRGPVAEVLPAIGGSAAALLFIALPFSYLVRLDGLENVGPQLLLFTLALVWAGDTVAYAVGRTIGRLPMAPALSPKKTWEGAAGNFLGSVLVGVAFARWMEADLLSFVVVAGLANIAGQFGDLLESAYKRGAGVKDSGILLPGHGGMLDRIDSLIFAVPVVWCYVGWLGKLAR